MSRQSSFRILIPVAVTLILLAETTMTVMKRNVWGGFPSRPVVEAVRCVQVLRSKKRQRVRVLS